MIKRFFIIVALLSTLLTAAQEGNSSPYSYYGIGLTKFRGTVENQSMGGLRVLSDSIHVNLRNPAAYGRLRLTTFTVAGSYTTSNITNGENKEENRNTSLDYLAIGLPTGRLNFGLGLIPYTTVGYRIEDINDETANRFYGRGGLNKVYFTAGYAITNQLLIGTTLNYNFGNIQNNLNAFQRGIQYGSRTINRTDLRGFNLNFGIDYQTSLNDNLEFFSAATYSPNMDITQEKSRNIATITNQADGTEIVIKDNTISFPDAKLTLPAELTLGAGLGKKNKWFLGAEYTNIQARNFTYENFNAGQEYSYNNASQYKLGGYYIPDYQSLTSYLKRVVYRGGLRYDETGLVLNNEGINEFGISFGLGLPAGTNFSNVNLGIEYGQRGTTNSGLIKENFFKFSLSLSLNDKWFVQSKFD